MKTKNYPHKKTKTIWLICIAVLFAIAGKVDNSTNARITDISQEVELTSSVKLYPNPASNTINIEYSIGENDNATINICDISGRIVKSTTLNSNTNFNTININEISNGVYFVSLLSNNTLVSNKKIVVMK